MKDLSPDLGVIPHVRADSPGPGVSMGAFWIGFTSGSAQSESPTWLSWPFVKSAMANTTLDTDVLFMTIIATNTPWSRGASPEPWLDAR